MSICTPCAFPEILAIFPDPMLYSWRGTRTRAYTPPGVFFLGVGVLGPRVQEMASAMPCTLSTTVREQPAPLHR
eukprot:gene7169-biopygen22506